MRATRVVPSRCALAVTCHCLTDTKTAGFYTTNIMGEADTLEVEGREHLKVGAAGIHSSSSGCRCHLRHLCCTCNRRPSAGRRTLAAAQA